MKKRLRKKKHVGEFKEWGAPVAIRVRENIDPDAFLDEFMEEVVVNQLCVFGGGGRDGVIEGFLELGKTKDLPEEKIKRIRDWLDRQDKVEKYVVGRPIDAWYGPFESMENILESL